MSDITTREICGRCQSVSAVGFYSPLWIGVAGRWSDDVLCVRCFAVLGDEKHIEWEIGIEFYPVSYATHHAHRDGETP